MRADAERPEKTHADLDQNAAIGGVHNDLRHFAAIQYPRG
jgi:hypothetical protein